MKSKGLFWVFFIIILSINNYISKYVYLFTIGLVSPSALDLLAILFYVIIVIPISIYFANQLTVYSLTKGLDKGKNFGVFMAIMIIVPVSFFTISKVNEYKEKGLVDVINHHPNKVHEIVINEARDQEWSTDKQAQIEELNQFFSQYRVKKMKDREWSGDVSNEKEFHVSIYSKGLTIASIFEERIHLYGDGYFKVMNGPIDMDWIESYQEKYD